MGKLMPLFCLVYFTLCSSPLFTSSLTLHSDIQVLHVMKRCIDLYSIPPNSYLSSWDFIHDPCETTGGQFLGVLCSFPLDQSPSRITAIDLDGAGYEGFITSEIGNLTELTFINLSKNNFRGQIPQSISNLKKLTRLSLSNNFFTGGIPLGLNTLKKLESLDISFNKLSGIIRSSIGGLRGLTFLSLSNNGFTGRIPDLSGLWQLKTLDLSRNQLFGSLPNFPISLRTLILSHNILSGSLTPLITLKNLRVLDASNNRLSGAITRDFFTIPKMARLNVSNNHFKLIEIIRFVGHGAQLQVLDAQRNQLRGHLPVNLVSLQNLTTINLSYNQFFGHIPEEYGARVGAWRTLYLDHNDLLGRLPAEFIKRPDRIKGSLSNNCLQCPDNIPLCTGRQRKISECQEHTDTNE
ncbi:leucine-rich repeat receptor-like serine/threonine-protein kinase BAM3 [Rosa rugosa]|uniref:leucine-rich repeat receptor-like serine/threonine-protein kinase BAM3 n=1 Tax=Rosa rugosa TaxID=74645 RepID=UPI002B413274|nr:leucine-rich repeat receptor-like serine/threonine-protein kinase BAM3 [Rosa rugosa]